MNSFPAPSGRSRGTGRTLASAAAATLTVAATASSAWALAPQPPVSQFAAPFVELRNMPGVGPITAAGCASSDDCLTPAFNISFPFEYYNQPKTQIKVSSNGWLTFDTRQTDNDRFNTTLPTSGTPNDLVAYWWDDLFSNTINYATVGTAPNRIFVVEWDYRDLGGSGSALAQVWLYEEDNAVEIHYGSISGLSNNSFAATVGFENGDGSFGVNLPCGTSCAESDLTALAGQVLRLGTTDGIELYVGQDELPRGGFPGDTLSGTVYAENFGRTPATNVLITLYLSDDDVLDASDPLVSTTTVATLPTGLTSVPMTLSIPSNLTNDDYFVIAEIDPNNRIVEGNETDNTTVLDQPFSTYYELAAADCIVTNPRGVANGESVSFDFHLRNEGVPFAGTLGVDVYASLDGTLDASDVMMGSSNVTFAATNQAIGSGSFVLPASSLTSGYYTPICVLDPAGVADERSTTNNTAAGSETFAVGSDFGIGAITMPGSVQPGASVNVSTTLTSDEVPYTGNVEYRLYLSLDDTIDSSDMVLGTYTVAFAGEAEIADVQSVTFASALAPGRYRILAVVDPRTAIDEVDETNNEGASESDIVNAIDFVAVSTSITPTDLEAGLEVRVRGQVSSTGLGFVGHVPFGVFFSPDETFDGGDFDVYRGLVFLASNGTGTVDVRFDLPPVQPGNLHVFLVVNPDNNPPEALRANNAVEAPNPVTVSGADVRGEQIVAPDIAFIGRQMEVSITISNESDAADARDFRYAYYLSDNELIRVVSDLEVFVSEPVSVPADSTRTFTDRIDIPSTYTSTQTLYLGAIVDINSDVSELNENNNITVRRPAISFVFPIPDLIGQVVGTATSAAAGEQLAVTRLIANSGVANSNRFEYTYYLSTNPAISTDDIAVGSFQLELGENEDDHAIDIVNLPPDVAPGKYYVGLILDPEDAIDEVYEDNNTAVGPSIEVFGAAITFTTDELSTATLGVAYEEGLYASGGPLPIQWSLTDGALPPGIELDMQAGLLSGTPTAEGLFTFTLRASSGTAYAERQFDIRVVSPTVPLTIATTTLRSAIAGRDYSGAQLVAVGGVPPYTWAVVSGEVPGLELSEQGVLSGRAITSGQYTLSVRVTDDLGQTASAPVAVSVVGPGSAIQIDRVPLPSAFVGQPFCSESSPFIFTARNVIGTGSWAAINGLPNGMTLSSDGELCGTPTIAGVFDLSVRVQDSAGLSDTALFRFEVFGNDACAITTASLPAAKVGVAYDREGAPVQLSTSGVCTDPVTWSIVEGAGGLPEGLTMSAEGVISGTPGENTAGPHAFLAQLTDATNTVSIQPLSIIVSAESTGGGLGGGDDGGCTCAAPVKSERSLAWLGFLPGLALVFRRRRR